jgi:tripartite ATP-independent transporter DctP family solute receptor
MKSDRSRHTGVQPEYRQSRRTLLKAGLGALTLVGLDPVIRRATAATAKTFKARLGHGQAVTTPLHMASLKLAELVKERSKGRFEIQVFPSSQLGTTTEMAEAIRLGTIDMYGAGNAFIEGIAPFTGVINVPGVFRDGDHAHRVVFGFVHTDVYERSLIPLGLRPIGYVTNEFRHVTNNKRPIKTLTDLKGLKIRVAPSKIMAETVQALGGSPVPIDWSELFSALQQGVVDGQENPFIQIYSAKLYEVQKHLALTSHNWDAYILLVNEKFYQSLDPELQQILGQAGKEASDLAWKESAKMTGELLDKLKGLGMSVTEIDPNGVREAVKVVWDSWASRVGPEGKRLIQRIVETK